MATLAQKADLATKTAFVNRAVAAILTVAEEVFAEPTDTQHHDARMMLAQAVIQAPLSRKDNMALAIAMSDTVCDAETAKITNTTAPGASDTQILARVRQVWNAFAGTENVFR